MLILLMKKSARWDFNFHNFFPNIQLNLHLFCFQAMKWKQTRGVFQAKLRDLIQINTPRVVMDNTKKAFRSLGKRHDLEAAISNLSALKGISPQFASAILVAYDPVEVKLKGLIFE